MRKIVPPYIVVTTQRFRSTCQSSPDKPGCVFVFLAKELEQSDTCLLGAKLETPYPWECHNKYVLVQTRTPLLKISYTSRCCNDTASHRLFREFLYERIIILKSRPVQKPANIAASRIAKRAMTKTNMSLASPFTDTYSFPSTYSFNEDPICLIFAIVQHDNRKCVLQFFHHITEA